jgi:solute carrier family 8 (sodium/calcium exchanger)
MEKEGFVRPITYSKENGLDIGELVTYRHVQLIKYIREEMPDTSHHFDVWHVAKGIKFEKSVPFFHFNSTV